MRAAWIVCISFFILTLAGDARAYVLAGPDSSLQPGSASWSWDGGSEIAPFRAALEDAANFGPGGTVAESITTMDLAVIDAGTLSGVDGFIGTYISDANGAPYAQAVADFFLAGGDLFLLQDTAGYDPIGSLLGVPTFSSSTGSVSNGSAPLFDGPFGTAMDVTQNGSTGELHPDDIAATGGTIAATNADGEVTAAVWNPGDYAPGAGSMVIFGDVDMISGPFGGATYDPLDDNGTFALNAVAFLLEGNEGCFQSGSSVNCVGTDPNGFENTDGGLDVTVQPDAIVNNPAGNGLTLGNGNDVDVFGTIDVSGDGINAGSGNTIANSSALTIIAGGAGINVTNNNDITNTGTITAMGNGIGAISGNQITNSGDIGAQQAGIELTGFGNTVDNEAGATITGVGAGIRVTSQVPNEVLVGAASPEGGGNSEFVVIDPTNAQVIANLGEQNGRLTGLAFDDATGTLFGSTGRSGCCANPANLVAVDPATGNVTVIGPYNVSGETAADISVDPTTGSLYGFFEPNVDDIGTIDPVTGQATLIPGAPGSSGSGLAFDSNGVLWQNDGTAFRNIDPVSGTSLSQFVVNDQVAGALAFDSNDTLFASDRFGTELFIIDTVAGTSTLVGDTGLFGLDAIEFIPGDIFGFFGTNIINNAGLIEVTGADPTDADMDGIPDNIFAAIDARLSGENSVLEIYNLNGGVITGMNEFIEVPDEGEQEEGALVQTARRAAILGGAGSELIDNQAGATINGDVILDGNSDALLLEGGSQLNGNVDFGDDADFQDVDFFVLYGDQDGAFGGDAIGADQLDKVGEGTFDLNGNVIVNSLLFFDVVPIDTNADGVEDAVADVFLFPVSTTVFEGRLNVGGLVTTTVPVDADGDGEQDLDPDTMQPLFEDVTLPATDAVLESGSVSVFPGATLGGHGTIITDPAISGGIFINGDVDVGRSPLSGTDINGTEFDDLTDAPIQGTLAPGTSIGTLNIVGGPVFFDPIVLETVQFLAVDDPATMDVDESDLDGDGETDLIDMTVVTNHGGKFESDLNDTGGHDRLNVVQAGLPTAIIDVPVDTTGPEGVPDGVFDAVEQQEIDSDDGKVFVAGTLDVVLDPEFVEDDPDTMDVDESLDANGNRIIQADYRSEAQVYDVIVAEGGVEGQFQAATFGGGPNDGAIQVRDDNPATMDVNEQNRIPVFKGYLEYQPDRVRITSIPDLTLGAVTPNQHTVANVIDDLVPYGLSTDPLTGIFSQVGVSGNIPAALDDLHPEWYTAYHEVAFNFTRGTLYQAELRSMEARHGTRSGSAITINATDNSTVGASEDDNRATFWISANYDGMDVNPRNGFQGYDVETFSGYVGFDYLVSDSVLLGVMGGFGNSDIDYDGRTGEGDVDSWQIAGYASFFGPQWFINVAGGYGEMDIENSRDITFGAVNLTALSEFDGEVTYFAAQAGYAFNIGNDGWRLTPEIGITYIDSKQDGFTETGAGAANLEVDPFDAESFRLSGQLRFSKVMRTESGGTYVPYVRVGIAHELEDDLQPITARFEGTTTDFTVFGMPAKKTTATFGAGISGQVGSGITLFLDYAGEIGGRFSDHNITGGARISF